MSDRSIKPTPGEKVPMKVLKTVSLREQIYDHLRERIRTGQLTFDDRLVDVDIASEFGVSRMPVREALMQLVHDGAIESTTRGFMLRRYSDREIADIFEIRRLLEPAAAEIAAGKMTESALAIMESAIQAGIKASDESDFTAFVVANAAFRGSLDGAGSEQAIDRGAGALFRSCADHPAGDAVATSGARRRAGASARDP